MHRVVLHMEMSSDDALASVEEVLRCMPGVTVGLAEANQCRHLTVTIDIDDPDAVDIVREIAWEHDPNAVQHSVRLADVS